MKSKSFKCPKKVIRAWARSQLISVVEVDSFSAATAISNAQDEFLKGLGIEISENDRLDYKDIFWCAADNKKLRKVRLRKDTTKLTDWVWGKLIK